MPLLQYLKQPSASSRKIVKHVRKLITEPHRIRAYFFYLTHPSYPLFTPDATRFLCRHLRTGMRVFEWGAGRSTIFLARSGVQLTSIEHDPGWHQAIGRTLSRYGLSQYVQFLKFSETASYGQVILNYPDNHFDLVVVDGRERLTCLLTAIPKVKPGGRLILDDSQRERYQLARVELERLGWAVQDFPYGFNRTTMWTKP